MGRPLGKHLMNAGYSLTLFDPIAESMQSLASEGAIIASSPADMAATTDVLIVLVGYPAEVTEALTGPKGFFTNARPGTIVIIGSTVSPELIKNLAAQGATKQIDLLDAPMARGEKGAIEGNLLWFVGGERNVLDKCKEILTVCGSDLYYLGGHGAGQVGKTVNNMLLWAALVADHEGFDLAQSYGVDTEELRKALVNSSASNWALVNWQHMNNIPWAQKDMNIVLEMADHAKIYLPMAGFIREQVKKHMYEAGF
jgi:3-hydroxyisobutyrate dehydrogenase-like beta-hydroxyacid dehydrogenase